MKGRRQPRRTTSGAAAILKRIVANPWSFLNSMEQTVERACREGASEGAAWAAIAADPALGYLDWVTRLVTGKIVKRGAYDKQITYDKHMEVMQRLGLEKLVPAADELIQRDARMEGGRLDAKRGVDSADRREYERWEALIKASPNYRPPKPPAPTPGELYCMKQAELEKAKRAADVAPTKGVHVVIKP
jgi:hypothetical protein